MIFCVISSKVYVKLVPNAKKCLKASVFPTFLATRAFYFMRGLNCKKKGIYFILYSHLQCTLSMQTFCIHFNFCMKKHRLPSIRIFGVISRRKLKKNSQSFKAFFFLIFQHFQYLEPNRGFFAALKLGFFKSPI